MSSSTDPILSRPDEQPEVLAIDVLKRLSARFDTGPEAARFLDEVGGWIEDEIRKIREHEVSSG